MVYQSLNMTSIWDDNYMILNSQYEKANMNNDLANAIQEYVASTITKSNIGGDNSGEKYKFKGVESILVTSVTFLLLLLYVKLPL